MDINAIDKELLASIEPLRQKPFFEVVRSALLSQGKRLRPRIGFLIAEYLGVDKKKVILPLLALEVIHTFSLIHDDLPGLDNDRERRGKPALHIVYGEGPALLAGDFLLSFSLEMVLGSHLLSPKEKSELSYALVCGVHTLIEGQFTDLEREKNRASLAFILDMYRKKTGVLFSLATTIPALLSEDSVKEKWQEYGFSFGVLYQIMDDFNDKEKDASKGNINIFLSCSKEEIELLVSKLYNELILVERLAFFAKKVFGEFVKEYLSSIPKEPVVAH